MKSRIIPLTLALTLGACSAKENSSATSAPASAPASPAPATSSASAGDPSANDISNYTLDMDKMNHWMATLKALGTEIKKDTTVADVINMDGDQTVEQSVAKLEASPAAKRALAASGMSARDYIMTSLAYMQAGMAAGLMKSVPGYKVPAGQNMKNVDFYKQHAAEFDKQMKQMSPDADN
jgi:hypothetical protein